MDTPTLPEFPPGSSHKLLEEASLRNSVNYFVHAIPPGQAVSRRESRRYSLVSPGTPPEFGNSGGIWLIRRDWLGHSRRDCGHYGGIPADMQSIPAGIPPICSLYRRDSRLYAVYTGGNPAYMQPVSAVLKQSTAAGFSPVYIYYWQDCCLHWNIHQVR